MSRTCVTWWRRDIMDMVAAQAAAPASSILCIACTLILTVLEEQALDGSAAQRELCELLGGADCSAGGASSLPTPDTLCQDLKLCEGAYAQCTLWPNNTWPPRTVTGADAGASELAALVGLGGDAGRARLRDAVVAASESLPPSMLFQTAQEVAAAAALREAQVAVRDGKFLDPCGLNITCLINRIGTLHLPLLDDDGDKFAPIGGGELDGLAGRSARGSHWRGADCNDKKASVYPGRRPAAADQFNAVEDTNCNGIKGVDPASGTAYEELWCSGANEPKGIAVLGDSATAHFHLPPIWLSASNFSLEKIIEQEPNAAGETVILLHPPLPLVGLSIWMERGCQ